MWPHRAELMHLRTLRSKRIPLWGLIAYGIFVTQAAAAMVPGQPNAMSSGSATQAASSSKVPGLGAIQSSPENGGNLQAWLQRVSTAAKQRNYSGVFVVQSGGAIVSSSIEHYVEGGQVLEKIETLDGQRRILLCDNAKTQTILPDDKLIVVENSGTDFSFPRLLRTPKADVAAMYTMQHVGAERCAGHMCNVTRIMPRDDLRYGYRLWTEQKSDLLVKAQTLDDHGKVLDEVAFTQLDLNPKVRADLIEHTLRGTNDYRVEHLVATPTNARVQGWRLRKPVPGFKSVGVFQRKLLLRDKPVEVTQWLFSDGLASVSLFVGPTADAKEHSASLRMGDTNALLARKGQWSVIAIGAVPTRTLQQFTSLITRIH